MQERADAGAEPLMSERTVSLIGALFGASSSPTTSNGDTEVATIWLNSVQKVV